MSEYKKLNITDWAVEDRPREKLQSIGAGSLSDAELIAILIGSGNPEETAVELSRRILAAVDNDLNQLGRCDLSFLTNFKGIGEAKAISIAAALELGRRRKEADVFKTQQIKSSADAAAVFAPKLADLNHEEFWVMLLTQANKIIHTYRISEGGMTGTVTDVRKILRTALEKKACSIILAHNHPSGNMQASQPDIAVTHKIKQAAEIMDIQVLDHIIIGQGSYFSFADEGKLN